MTAAELADAQRSIVNGDTRTATAEEVAYYEEKSTQAAADEAARWYKPDRSKLTTKERYRSQLLKDTMLSNSFKAPTRQSSLLLPGV
jgi:outer membrane biosynthesis protein TonB